EEGRQIAEEKIEVAEGTTYVNTNAFADLVPEGYELVVSGDLAVNDGYVYAVVRKAEAKTETVTINFYSEEEGRQIAEEKIEVAEGTTYVNTNAFADLVPEGYELVVSGDLAVNDGYVYAVVRKAAVKNIKLNFYDETAEKQVAEVEFEVEKDATYVNTGDIAGLVPEGYELVVSGDLVIEDGYVYVSVRKSEAKTQTVTINFYDEEAEKQIAESTIEVDAEATYVNTNTIEALVPEGYELVLAGDLEIRDGYVYAAVRKTSETPEVEEKTATLDVVYKDGNAEVGREKVTAVGEAGKDHTFTADALTIPEGYELAADFADVTVKYGETASVEVAVKAISNPDVPVEMANATLHISYAYNGREISSQDITVVGKKGESYTFTAENVALQVPNGYKLSKEFADVTVVFSETKNIELAVSYLGGGSGSGGSGSSSGGGSSSSGSSSSSHQLESGRWIQDSTGWWYSFNNGTYAKSGWYSLKWENKIDWYYFNDAGYLISGWFEDKGLKYYLHDLHDGTFGRMYTGWNKIGGQWYYFNDTTEGVLGALKADVQVPDELLNK
ncbi:MAG: mucin-binding protein, partial [Lachnospirales bacterium]